MRRPDRFPHARPERPPHVRMAAIGGILALGILLAAPSSAPHDRSLDLAADLAGQAAVGQEPTAPDATAASPAPSVAVPTPTPAPTADPVTAKFRTGPGTVPDRLMAEWIGVPPTPAELTGYRWPLAHPRLTLPFGPSPWGSRIVDGQRFHDGIDMATFCGDRVTAAHGGRVLAAGRHFDDWMGWVGSLDRYYRRLDTKHLWSELPIVVVVDDGNGYRSMYAHFGRVVVKSGQMVKAGQLLGYEGATGRASGCHVHYGLFSPWETATFRIAADTAKRMQLPDREIARIDPMVVLPPKPSAKSPAAPSPSAGP